MQFILQHDTFGRAFFYNCRRYKHFSAQILAGLGGFRYTQCEIKFEIMLAELIDQCSHYKVGQATTI